MVKASNNIHVHDEIGSMKREREKGDDGCRGGVEEVKAKRNDMKRKNLERCIFVLLLSFVPLFLLFFMLKARYCSGSITHAFRRNHLGFFGDSSSSSSYSISISIVQHHQHPH